jgi:hypothetical protein
MEMIDMADDKRPVILKKKKMEIEMIDMAEFPTF